MNELYISDCWIYFETKEKTYDKAMDNFLKRCVDAGILEGLACETKMEMK